MIFIIVVYAIAKFTRLLNKNGQNSNITGLTLASYVIREQIGLLKYILEVPKEPRYVQWPVAVAVIHDDTLPMEENQP
jgi:hypothetical protein